VETLDGAGGAEMQAGDRIVIETPGGGGYGGIGEERASIE
jgi:5-oxoprolinase (ATP-hydrolysing)